MATSIPRYLLPRGFSFGDISSRVLSKSPKATAHPLPLCRHASANTSKPRVLEKPAKFNPPSHGKRLRQQIPRHYGPELTQQQKTEQATKKYPNMMPAPNTFMFWFLTSHSLHVFISLGFLVLLASFTAFENWRRATTFREQLPEPRAFFSHPIASFYQCMEVWKMDVMRTSAETAEKRKKGIDDVQKRSTYRRAHGLEDENAQGLGSWTVRSDEKSMGPSLQGEGPIGRPMPAKSTRNGHTATEETTGEAVYADWEGNTKPVKKWFGIW